MGGFVLVCVHCVCGSVCVSLLYVHCAWLCDVVYVFRAYCFGGGKVCVERSRMLAHNYCTLFLCNTVALCL